MKSSLRSKLDSLSQRLEELNRLLSAEDATRDMEAFKRLSREHADVSRVVELYNGYRQAERDAADAREMASDPSMKALAEEGAVPTSTVGEAIAKYQIKTDKINPLYA